MGWPDAIVEIVRLLKEMPRWMSALLLMTLFLLALGYAWGKLFSS